MPPSDITLTANVSIWGVYSIRAAGNNYFKGNRSRLNYELFFFNEPLFLWGIRYQTTSVNPSTHYTRQDVRVNTQYIYWMTGNFYIGGIFDFTYKHIRKIDDISYLDGQFLSYLNTGLGFSVQYDTRDFIPNPGQGMYLLFQEVVYPQATGNYHRTLFRTTLIADLYRKVWTGGLIALDLY
ncbi:MAG: outer membrane protein assembly factor [Bacteroides sp.]|nr:outer membrane protein assembly factor [Bacteroides sp.]